MCLRVYFVGLSWALPNLSMRSVQCGGTGQVKVAPLITAGPCTASPGFMASQPNTRASATGVMPNSSARDAALAFTPADFFFGHSV